MGQNQSVNKK